MSRDCKINKNRWVTTPPEERSLRLIVLACILFVLTTAATSFAKGGDLLTNFPVVDSRAAWQKAAAMAVDSAGNIIVVGDMDNGSNKDYQLVKFKADGTGLAAWAPVSYGHGTADNDIATAVAVDADDNIIVTGTVWNGSNNDSIPSNTMAPAEPSSGSIPMIREAPIPRRQSRWIVPKIFMSPARLSMGSSGTIT